MYVLSVSESIILSTWHAAALIPTPLNYSLYWPWPPLGGRQWDSTFSGEQTPLRQHPLGQGYTTHVINDKQALPGRPWDLAFHKGGSQMWQCLHPHGVILYTDSLQGCLQVLCCALYGCNTTEEHSVVILQVTNAIRTWFEQILIGHSYQKMLWPKLKISIPFWMRIIILENGPIWNLDSVSIYKFVWLIFIFYLLCAYCTEATQNWLGNGDCVLLGLKFIVSMSGFKQGP